MALYQARDSRDWQWWTGYSDTSGSWRWEDGNNVTSMVIWSPGEPNNYAGIEHCGETTSSGNMNDNNCDNVMPYICKSVKGNPSRCPPGWQDVERSCYRYFDTELNWNEARSDCQRYGGDLADIQTDTEQQYLLDTVKCQKKASWIGLQAKLTTAPGYKFEWVTGDDLGSGTTARWAQQQPFIDRSRLNTTCVEIITSAPTAREAWATAQCSVERPYICKKPEGVCASGWKINKNTCYQFNSNLKLSWVDADDYCNSQGGSMATPYSPEIQAFMKTNKGEFSQKSSFWIGGKGTSDGSGVEWVDGTPISTTSPNWSTQPNGQLNSSCVQIYAGDANAKWSINNNCLQEQPFVCQIGSEQVVLPPTVAPAKGSCENGWEAFSFYCYYFSTNSTTWAKAEQTCTSMGAHLVSIISQRENSFIDSKLSDNAWLGFNDKGFEGTWIWTSQTDVPYTNWNIASWTKEPNNYGKNGVAENCAEVIGSSGNLKGKWNDIMCSLDRQFVCKKGAMPLQSTTPKTTVSWSSKCGPFWEDDPLNDFCYQFNSDELTWHDAQSHCQANGGELASITSPLEQSFITNRISSIAYPITFWLGGNDLGTEGGWQWTDGSPFSFLNWDVDKFGVMDKKNYSEPNNRWTEDCMQITSEFGPGLWNDIGCNTRIGYICKKKGLVSTTVSRPPSTTPLPAGKTFGCWQGWKKYGDGCFQLNSEEVSWQDARTQCRLKGGDLASVKDDSEQAFLTTQTKANTSLTNRIFWLGLNDLQRPMTFKWTDDSEVTYTNWNKGEPNNNVGKDEDCVTMNGDLQGTWNDDSCAKTYMYICRTPLQVVSASSFITMSPLFPAGCPSGTTAALGYSCYSFISMGATWADAERYCVRGGGHLAALKSFIVQAYMYTKLKNQPSDSYWIGLSNPTGIYRWSENSSAWYTNWDSTHSGNGANRCVTMDKPNGKWTDRDCSISRTFICEFPKSDFGTVTRAPTTTTTPVAASCPAQWVDRSGYCYKAVYNTDAKKLKTWLEAREDCRSYGGDLLSLHSSDEELFATSSSTYRAAGSPGFRSVNTFHFLRGLTLLRMYYLSGSFWIGLNNRDPSRPHVWSDGSGTDYTNWDKDEPNNHNGQENCVEVSIGYGGGKWRDSNCYLARNYFCKIRKGAQPPPTPSAPITIAPTDCGATDWFGYGNNCYYVTPSNTRKNWYAARDWCRQNGGDLASIHGNTENGFITSIISKVYTRNTALWIGLNELNLVSYSWSDGTATDFENWNSNEPNDWNGGQRCVDIYTGSGTWNDDNCGDNNGFICMRHKDSMSPITTPPTPALPGNCPRGYYAIGNKCYGFYGDSILQLKNWTMARDYCASLGKSYSLASITNQLEQSFVTTMLQDKTYEMWIGLNDKTQEGRYHWVDNQPVAYTNWDRGEPSNNAGSYGDEDCVIIKTSTRTAGKWQSRSCSFETGFLCQTWKGFPSQTNPSLGTTWLPNSTPGIQCNGKPGYTGYMDACYKVDTSVMRTWDEAVQYCRQDGATLAVVTNNFEQAYLNLLGNDVDYPMWLALYYDTTYKIYQWKDSPWSLVYVNWAGGVRLDDPGRRCVSMNSTGQWVTSDCNAKLVTLCKYTTVTPSPTPPEEAGYCPDSTWVPKGRYCYYIHGVSYQNWAESSLSCYKKGGNLVSVTSQFETNFILDTIATSNARVSSMLWIGLLKKENSGFGWYDGSPFNFQNWMPGQPSNRTFRGAEDCAAMSSSSGQWNDVTCGTKRNMGYICKRLKSSATTPFKVPTSTPPPVIPSASSSVIKPTSSSSSSLSSSSTARPQSSKSPTGISIKPNSNSQTQGQPGKSSSSLPLIIGLTLAAVVVVAVIGAVVMVFVCRKNTNLGVPFSSFDNAAYEKDTDHVRINGDLANGSHNNGIVTRLKENGNHSNGLENPAFQEEAPVSNGNHGNVNLHSGSNSEC